MRFQNVCRFACAAILIVTQSTRLLIAGEPSHKIASVEKAPAGLAAAVSATLNPKGHRVDGPDGPICEVWLVKELVLKAGFRPSLSVKYPFTPGQLIGALRVAPGSQFTDFRGQEIAPAVYTLRYGQQPEDGNHIGTSELADFLLVLPAAGDTGTTAITDFDDLAERSAESADSSHPAILSLLPIKKPPEKSALTHNEDDDFWILNLFTRGRDKESSVPVQLRIVAIGETDV
jgi:hypothetical protein